MRIIDLTEPEVISSGSCCVALGRFDGVHIAHRSLIERAREEKQRRNDGTLLGVFTFYDALKGDITTFREKAEIFESLGVDCLFVAHFDSIRDLSPSEFFDTLLKRMGAVYLTCGFNYRFGRGASGNTETLEKLCKERNIGCFVSERIIFEGVTVSSSYVRELIASGDTEKAAKILTSPFSVEGKVERGYMRGREMGFPTLNIKYPSEKISLCSGVYLTLSTYDRKEYFGITNVGRNPTLPKDELMSETHILGEIGDIYGKTVKVAFLKRIRSERKFADLSELSLQIESDKTSALEMIRELKGI